MAKSGFYNQNLNRAFPFQLGTVNNPLAASGTVDRMPDNLIADAGFVLGNGSGFETGVNSVWLEKIERVSDEFTFTFASDAPGLYTLVLEFTRALGDPDLAVQFVTDTSDAPWHPRHSESVSINPDPVSACFFLGSSGTFRPPRSGPLKFFFNDSFFPDNTGSFTLVFDGHTYTVPCTEGGVDGPFVHAGRDYSYSASGTIMYRPHSNPANNQHATPDGDVHFQRQVAPWECPCPGSRWYGLVTRLLEIDKHSESVAVSDTVRKPVPQLWSGYLVTGSMAALAALLPADGAITRDSGGLVEPALLQNLAGSYVTSINLANQDRTRVTAAAGCPEQTWPYPTGPQVLYTAAMQLGSDIHISAGFNASAVQNSYDNSITLAAVPGGGAGAACSEVPLFFGEIPPFNASLLDGSPQCSQVIQSINGTGGAFTSLLGGRGVSITAVPGEHKLVIDADMAQMAVCFSDSLDISQISEALP